MATTATCRALAFLTSSPSLSFIRSLSVTPLLRSNVKTSDEAIFTSEHVEMRAALNKLIEKEINPYVDEWEAARSFPVHSVIKKLGEGGFLGPTRDPAYGGLGLDYTYSIAIAEELGSITCGGVPMAIGVHSGKREESKRVLMHVHVKVMYTN